MVSRYGSDPGKYRAAREATLEAAEITDPVILVRINRLFRPGMSDEELYQATRTAWRVGVRREAARYALALYAGNVREVYDIDGWQPADTPGRWEFRGNVADESVRSRYVGRSVRHYLRQGNQSPILYVNC